MSMASAPVSATRCLSCSIFVAVDFQYPGPAAYKWEGNLYGDLDGTIVLLGEPPTFTGADAIEHYRESFTVTLNDGTEIKGIEKGIFNMRTSNAVANGEITEVLNGGAEDWTWLVGYQVHYSGVVYLDIWCFFGEFSAMPSKS
jgi:hypothetical protein